MFADNSQHVSKRARFLSDDESSGGSDAESTDLGLLKVNAEYATRFEHNKKREERQKRKTLPNIIWLYTAAL